MMTTRIAGRLAGVPLALGIGLRSAADAQAQKAESSTS